MKLEGARLLTTRSARRVLDKARNPAGITHRAVKRFIEDAAKAGLQIDAGDLFTARQKIIEVCQKAQKIYRGKNSYILFSSPWWIFYRDGVVVTVMHDNANRRLTRGAMQC